MPICKKCNNNFSVRQRIDGKYHNLQNRKYCIECSPFDKHNTSQIHIVPSDKKIFCTICKREYIYDSKKGHTLTKCNSCAVNERRLKIKKQAIEYKGGECERCGYNKCLSALEFHHSDPDKKEFSLSGSHCYSWEKIKKELDKCILICANCHREIHEDIKPSLCFQY